MKTIGVIGAGVGLSMPSITSAASASLAAHQTSTGSAVPLRLRRRQWLMRSVSVST